MPYFELDLESGEDSLSTRRFHVVERINSLFEVTLYLRSPKADIDLEKTVGKGGVFYLESGIAHALTPARLWAGVVSHFEQVQAEVSEVGQSTYMMRIVPWLWLATQRRNHRIFQHMTIPDIVDAILAEWEIAPVWQIDPTLYHKLEYRVQYGETDYAFMCRLLEEAGITFYYTDNNEDDSLLILNDKPTLVDARVGLPIPYVDNPNQAANREFVQHVRLTQEVRPGAFTLRDFDFRRKPDYQLFGKALASQPESALREQKYEQYVYEPGSMLIDDAKAGETPVSDDKGVARNDDKNGADKAAIALTGIRSSTRLIQFVTNAVDLTPGVIFKMSNHPRSDINMDTRLFIIEFEIDGTPTGEWRMRGMCLFAEEAYRPAQRTPKPIISGLQSAIVVGPPGEEIYTDEFGRVRVQFHWDRVGTWDDNSSCWMRVSQGWAGHGFGMITIPRIGHEVLVGFFEGDPDQPVIVGRVYNNTTRVPYKLPDNKTKSTWKSDSSPGSNGFNEIMFEDAKGKELVYIQAQRDLHKLVKNNESEQIGNNRSVTVGNDRSTNIGNVDALTVGVKHTVQISQGKDASASGPATGLEMVDKKVTYTTGEATMIMDGSNVSLEAKGNITIKSTGGDVVILGKMVKIN
jgi:type VI secretion system secreted protein VgrG